MQATPPPKPESPSKMPKIPGPALLPQQVGTEPDSRVPLWLLITIMAIAAVVLTVAIGMK